MTGNHLFRSSAIALLALIARGGAAAWGQGPAAPPPIKMRYDEDAKTGYSVSNSDQLLKVRLWIADPLQQAKIMENGLELWIDTKGKKNKITGILYPLPSAAEVSAKVGRPQQQAGDGPPERDNHKPERVALQPLIDRQKEIKLVGFGDELNGLQNQHHPSGIDVTLRVVNDTLFYEAQIPLQLLPATEKGAMAKLGIGIIEKGKDPATLKNDELPGGGGPPGGDGDGMGAGGPPPGGGGPPPDMEDIHQLYSINTIWYKYELYRQ